MVATTVESRDFNLGALDKILHILHGRKFPCSCKMVLLQAREGAWFGFRATYASTPLTLGEVSQLLCGLALQLQTS